MNLRQAIRQMRDDVENTSAAIGAQEAFLITMRTAENYLWEHEEEFITSNDLKHATPININPQKTLPPVVSRDEVRIICQSQGFILSTDILKVYAILKDLGIVILDEGEKP